MTRALVTGASGFIGRALVDRLIADGHEVVAVSRRPQPAEDGVRWVEADLADAAAVDALFAAARPRVVHHLASRVTGARDLDEVLPTLAANLDAAVHVFTSAARAGVGRIVLAGSMEEPAPGQVPPSPYAAAKAGAGVYAQLFTALYGVEVVRLRIHMVYGPGQRDLRKLVPSATLALLDGQAPRISSGVRRVDWVHRDDVVDALVAAAEVVAIPEGPVDIGTGVATSVREVVERLCAITGGSAPVIGAVEDRPLEVEPVADVEAAEAALGWRARRGLEEGLRDTVAWYAAHRDGLR